MTLHHYSNLLQRCLIACSALLLCSCGMFADKPQPYNIHIAYAPETIDQFRIYPSVEVDLIGCNDIESKRLLAASIDDYFRPNSSLRNSLSKKTFLFSEEKPTEQVLLTKDPIWDKWLKKQGVTELTLLVNLLQESKEATDGRILQIPLYQSRWDDEDIEILITPAGLSLRTHLKPQN
ncbi:MAG: hypothetical protein RR553_01320 [Akkermansia sp.]